MYNQLSHNYIGMLYGLPTVLTNRLWRMQSCAVRMVTGAAGHDHITPILYSLHWLPVSARIKYKMLLLTFKCIQGIPPAYHLCHQAIPARALTTLCRPALACERQDPYWDWWPGFQELYFIPMECIVPTD